MEAKDPQVSFNPLQGVEDIDNGAKQIPALGLIHELDHANQYLNLFRTAKDAVQSETEKQNITAYSVWEANKDRTTDAGVYQTVEEKRVITGVETQTVNELKAKHPQQEGLGLRSSHYGNIIRTKGPLSIKKK